MAGMDRGSSERVQGCDLITTKVGRIRYQWSAQADIVVPGVKLVLPTVVTVGTTVGIV